ncbi:exodeoxyribonuclease VII large subunit [Rhodovulum sulfidophilum]|uniref:exodeoxyribonuclease VII large subunit n=1 Tax=Rhodovulum sulfidophilum TaxID=35806 RepID=UPI0019242350|nr:exodeoxyribonuclease VII large subunit [Rhodovulum sulfidophilum]MBL3574348.1 exodeoxyribonuclease VII large subunit [Rhodovulum sulfidophilum]MCE8431929.1 exodeoxyribonuclease VII large subunit [Rhodovulum sulfidophilum]MCF4117728.1 exodeoxyribonuclease VII large subunit [Rhodovulum sulfidophilum]
MSDLIDDDGPGGPNSPEFTVSEISGAVKRTVEGAFSHVRVRGEVGRVSLPRSGHIYLDLKDDRNVLASVIWKGTAQRLATRPEEGMEVIATGRLTTFGGQSRYQMVIEDIAPAGVGALMAMLEKRKAALAAEGLFAAERKRALPYLPRVIGVVTSPSGAVIRDILHRLGDRFPRHVLIWPVAVQGAACAPEVARAIQGFNALPEGGAIPRPDLLIVARGGGSLEDLWGFNEEIVVRAAAASQIPLISAVGHETDTTLIDHVADRRAPTPTAAAEMAVPVRIELIAALDGLEARRSAALGRLLSQRRQRLADLARALPRPETLLNFAAQRLDRAADRLPAALSARVARERLRLSEAGAALRPASLRRRLAEERRRADERVARVAPALARLRRLRASELEKAAGRVRPELLQRRVETGREALARLDARLRAALGAGFERRRARLEALERMRAGLSYRETLRRGFAVVRAGGQVVTSQAAAEQAGALEIEFRDGRFATAGRPPRRSRKTDEPPEQGTLL